MTFITICSFSFYSTFSIFISISTTSSIFFHFHDIIDSSTPVLLLPRSSPLFTFNLSFLLHFYYQTFLSLFKQTNTHTHTHTHTHTTSCLLPHLALSYPIPCTVYSQIGSVSPDCAGSQLTDLRNCFECVQVHLTSTSSSAIPYFTHSST